MDRERIGYSPAEAATIIGGGRTKLYEAISSGILPARKFGRRTIILHEDLHAYAQKLPPLKPSKLAEAA